MMVLSRGLDNEAQDLQRRAQHLQREQHHGRRRRALGDGAVGVEVREKRDANVQRHRAGAASAHLQGKK